MADHFEGETSDLSDAQLNLIRKVFAENGVEDAKIQVSHVGKRGDNYMANVVRFSAKRDDGKCFSVVTKIAPKIDTLRQMIQSVTAFYNETVMYTKVLPKFEELQQKVGASKDNFLRYPKCYGVINEEPDELIVLEDLKNSGYEMRDRFVSLTNEEMKLVIADLAKLHALGFVLKEKHPDTFNDLKQSLKNVFDVFVASEDFKTMWSMVVDMAVKFIGPELVKRIHGGFDDIIEPGLEVRRNCKNPCIVQGDCWTNNIMFSSEVSKPLDCILIDYQMSGAASPAIDLMYSIFNCTDRETRQKNYYNWLDLYHNTLDRVLSDFDLKAASVYSRETMDSDLKEHGRFMYGMAIMLSNILTRDVDDVVQVGEMDVTNKEAMEEFYTMSNAKECTLQRQEKRLKDITLCFLDYGYL